MKSAIVLLLVSGYLRAQQGSLEGTAIHAVTREPLSRVHVRLVGGSFAGISGAYGAMSDRTGHFSIASTRGNRRRSSCRVNCSGTCIKHRISNNRRLAQAPLQLQTILGVDDVYSARR